MLQLIKNVNVTGEWGCVMWAMHSVAMLLVLLQFISFPLNMFSQIFWGVPDLCSQVPSPGVSLGRLKLECILSLFVRLKDCFKRLCHLSEWDLSGQLESVLATQLEKRRQREGEGE